MRESIVRKLQKYCAYQERAHSEVRKKLLDLQIYGEELEETISHLISEGFLNEERYAKTYSLSKFNQKSWGKLKIASALKQKGISQRNITVGLLEIDSEKYEQCIKRLISSRFSGSLPVSYEEKSKITRYLQSKGFELDLIMNNF
jgi:regulatory protein